MTAPQNGPQRSGRSRRGGGGGLFPQAGKRRGSGGTRQAPAALARPGRCHSNRGHRLHLPPPARGAAICAGRASSPPPAPEVRSAGGHGPPWKSFAVGFHPAESLVLLARQNGCGNPDRAPTKACSRPGLRLQGVPERFTGNGEQLREVSPVARAAA